MAINYTPVGWDISDYVNPTNMNQMDSGIKAACDGVDKLEKDIANTNSNLSNIVKMHTYTGVVANNGLLTTDVANQSKNIISVVVDQSYSPAIYVGGWTRHSNGYITVLLVDYENKPLTTSPNITVRLYYI